MILAINGIVVQFGRIESFFFIENANALKESKRRCNPNRSLRMFCPNFVRLRMSRLKLRALRPTGPSPALRPGPSRGAGASTHCDTVTLTSFITSSMPVSNTGTLKDLATSEYHFRRLSLARRSRSEAHRTVTRHGDVTRRGQDSRAETQACPRQANSERIARATQPG